MISCVISLAILTRNCLRLRMLCVFIDIFFFTLFVPFQKPGIDKDDDYLIEIGGLGNYH